MKKIELVYYEEADESHDDKLEFEEKLKLIYDEQTGEDFLLHISLSTYSDNTSVDIKGVEISALYPELDLIEVKNYYDGIQLEGKNKTTGKVYMRNKYTQNFITYFALMVRPPTVEDENPFA